MSFPWMSMYWAEYLGDTGHLSTIEHGAYLLLIAHYWTTAKPLPDNDVLLARITRMSPQEWSNAKALLQDFFSIESGMWKHKRVEEELDLARQRYEKRSSAGRKGGKAKRKAKDESQDEALLEQRQGNEEARDKQSQSQEQLQDHLTPPRADAPVSVDILLAGKDPAAGPRTDSDLGNLFIRRGFLLHQVQTAKMIQGIRRWIELNTTWQDCVDAIVAGDAKLGKKPDKPEWYLGFIDDVLRERHRARAGPPGDQRSAPVGTKGSGGLNAAGQRESLGERATRARERLERG